jgi:hypothetical protein
LHDKGLIMKKEIIAKLHKSFEEKAHVEQGIEY